jgi:hypothetical protein
VIRQPNVQLPKRAGLDFWPTPPDVCAALVQHVLPVFGPGVRIWECAAGDGRLGDAIAAAGYDVIILLGAKQRHWSPIHPLLAPGSATSLSPAPSPS